jgi:importin-5
MAALLPPEVHQALTQLLHGLQSADNVLRTEAEERLANEWSTPRPGVLLIGLSEQLQGAEDTAVCPSCSYFLNPIYH